MGFRVLIGDKELSTGTFQSILKERFGSRADEAYRLYSAETPIELEQAATDLAGDLFIAFSTWKWGELHGQVTSSPIYRYYYTRPRPAMRRSLPTRSQDSPAELLEGSDDVKPPEPLVHGAVHSAEIEYAMGNLPTNRVYDWQPDDYKVSAIMQAYFANFIKSGDPNGLGLPEWPALNSSKDRPVAVIDVNTHVRPAEHRDRYLFLGEVEAAGGN